MVSFDLGTARSLLFTLGPFVIPRLYAFYKSRRAAAANASKNHSKPIPLPPAVSRSLNILFVSALLFIATTLPTFSPENIFTLTSSRLQTPTDVLFTRLSSLRPNHTLTLQDEALKLKLANIDSRCLYLAYGPTTTLDCPFCMSDSPKTYYYYTLPSILFPHLLQLFLFGIATSRAIGGKWASRWRTTATCLALAIAGWDLLLTGNVDWKANARVFHGERLNHFHWRMRIIRGVGLALSDVLLALLLYLTATNRILKIHPGAAERVEEITKLAESARGKLAAVGILKNAVVRDDGLSEKSREYWRRERMVMGEVMEEGEVVEGVRNALSGRVQVGRVEEEARKYAEGIVWTGGPPAQGAGQEGEGAQWVPEAMQG